MPDEEPRVISGIELDIQNVKLRSPRSKILRGLPVADEGGRKTQIVGGDAPDVGGEKGIPAIIIEKKGDSISRIIVKCPCGRHSELICEYEDGGQQQ